MSQRYYEFFRKTAQLSFLTVLLLGQGINAGIAHDPQKKELQIKFLKNWNYQQKGIQVQLALMLRGVLMVPKRYHLVDQTGKYCTLAEKGIGVTQKQLD